MLNTVTNHGTCTIIFGLAGLIVSLICCLPRTLLNVSYMSIASFASILGAVMITMIGVGVEKPGDQKVVVAVSSDLATGFLAATNIVFAYSGHVAFFSFISELKNPEEYPKALYLLQGIDTSMYLIVAIVTYRYAGSDVASPALGSTSPLLQKVAYGIAIPTIVVAGVINGHVAAKYIYVRLFRGTDRMSKRLGDDRDRTLGCRMDNCRGYPCVQRSVGFDQLIVRELVYIRLEWCLLAVSEQGTI